MARFFDRFLDRRRKPANIRAVKGRVRTGVVLDGTYHIVRLVGEGGMGEVYEARHARLAGRYAVKVLHPEIRKHPEVLMRFQREAQITSALRHPGIVQVIDFNTAPNGSPYLVMEYLEGEDLGQVITRDGPFILERVVLLATQIASALAAAHRKGVVHRDLKPQNIFLLPPEQEETERAKVLDFGISKIRSVSRKLTATSVVLGTPQFMAPEQAEGKEELDAAADQFSFAAIIYEMLTARPAFTGDTLASVVYQIVHAHPTPVTKLRPALPSEIHTVLSRALSKDRAERFQSTSEFARALRAAAGFGVDPLGSGAVAIASEASARVPTGEAPVRVSLPTLALGSPAPPRASARVSVDPAPSAGDTQPDAASSGHAFSTTTFRRMTGEMFRLRELLSSRKALLSLGGGLAIVVLLIGVIAAGRRSPTTKPAPSPAAVAVAHVPSVQPLPKVSPPAPAVPAVAMGAGGAPLTVDGALAEFELASEPAGLLVKVDGKPFPGADNQAVTRMRGSLPSGPHTLELASAGYQTWRKSVELKTGVPNRFLARLRKDDDPAAIFAGLKPSRSAVAATVPPPPAVPAPTPAAEPVRCSLTVGATPWAELWIDGRDTHRHTPVVNQVVPCGPRQITLKRPDLNIEYQAEEILIPGEPLKRVYKLASP